MISATYSSTDSVSHIQRMVNYQMIKPSTKFVDFILAKDYLFDQTLHSYDQDYRGTADCIVNCIRLIHFSVDEFCAKYTEYNPKNLISALVLQILISYFIKTRTVVSPKVKNFITDKCLILLQIQREPGGIRLLNSCKKIIKPLLFERDVEWVNNLVYYIEKLETL